MDPTKKPAYEVLPILRKYDHEGRFQIFSAYWVHTMDVKVHIEKTSDGLNVYIPEIFRAAPREVLNSRLKLLMSRMYGQDSEDGTSHARVPKNLVQWVYSADFVYAYREVLQKFTTTFFINKGSTPSMELMGVAKDLIKLIPEYRSRLCMLRVGIRNEALDLTRAPMTSTSLPGQLVMLDPALVAPGVPRILAKYAIFNEMFWISVMYGGLRSLNITVVEERREIRARFKGYEKVEEAYVRLGWFFERSTLDRCGVKSAPVRGRTIDRCSYRESDKVEVPPVGDMGLRMEGGGIQDEREGQDRPDDEELRRGTCGVCIPGFHGVQVDIR